MLGPSIRVLVAPNQLCSRFVQRFFAEEATAEIGTSGVGAQKNELSLLEISGPDDQTWEKNNIPKELSKWTCATVRPVVFGYPI